MPVAARSAIVFVISTFLIKGVTFLVTPIFTRLMPQEEYGVVATYNSWVTILEVFALLGLTSAGVFNVGLKDHKEQRSEYLASVLALCNVITIVFFGILFAAQMISGQEFILSNNLLFLMTLRMLFSPAQVFWITRQKYEYRYKIPALLTIVSAIFSQIISIIAVYFYTGDNVAEIKLWSGNLVVIACSLPIYFHIFIKGRKSKILSYWKKILILALPLIPHYLAQHIMSSADKIMLEKMIAPVEEGLRQIAIYSVVANMGLIASILWGALNGSLVPYVFDKLDNKEYNVLNKTTIALLAVYGLLCVAVSLVAPEIMKILAPKKYFEGISAVPPIVCTAFLTAGYNVFANVEFYHKKTGWIAFSTIVATLVNIGLNIWLIPRFGFSGAAYTTLISYVVLLAMHFWGYRQASRKEKVFKDCLLLAVMGACVALCIASRLLYSYIVIRYILLGAGLFLGLWKRKTLFALFRRKTKQQPLQELRTEAVETEGTNTNE